MIVDLKPIAESKVRQLGGDVCGVLVRKDDRLAAVDEHGRVQWLQDDGGEYAAYLEGMNSHLKAELQAARAQQVGSGEALAERKKPLAVKRSKISAGNYKAVRQDGEVFIIQKGVVAKGWTIENQRTYKIDSAVDLSQANYMITNCVGKVCAQSDHFGAATIPAGWHIHRYSDRMSMAHDSKRFPHRSFLFGGDDSQAMIAEFLSDLAFSAPQPAQQGSVPESIAADDDVERVTKMAERDDLAELVLSGMKDCGYYPYETDASGIADSILSRYNLEPKP